MTLTTSPPSSIACRRPPRIPAGVLKRSGHSTPTQAECGGPVPEGGVASWSKLAPLGRYTEPTGHAREVIAMRRGDGSVLVVDRDAVTLGDRRLVAHLAVDEPTENAVLVCAHYLRDTSRGRCRQVTAEDLAGTSSVEKEEPIHPADGSPHRIEFAGRRGDCSRVYRLGLVRTGSSAMALRWRRHLRPGGTATPTTVCLREVIGAIESYEPVCGLTLGTLGMYKEDPRVSTSVLRGELERLRESPIVLNRKLRHAVLATIEQHGLSMSEIAIRCGRLKRDPRGNASGETSWLARRVGILPESGTTQPTPWVHSDVLALIARDGLGISPREVELG